jgi:hypothetical protein
MGTTQVTQMEATISIMEITMGRMVRKTKICCRELIME